MAPRVHLCLLIWKVGYLVFSAILLKNQKYLEVQQELTTVPIENMAVV